MQHLNTNSRWIVAAALILSASAPALAQAAGGQDGNGGFGAASPSRFEGVPRTSMSEVMAGRDVPLSIGVKDLSTAFRRVVIGGQPDVFALQMRMAGVETGLYFTRGNTVSVGGETYLVAYRPQQRLDPAMLRGGHGHGHGEEEAPTPPRLRLNERLSLSLLNLRTTDNINDIRPFDAGQDVETPQQSTAASTRNLERLGQGLLTWLNNRGGVLPVMGESVTPALQRTFYPFVHDQRQWQNPSNDEMYRPNTRLSKVRVRSIQNPKFVYAFYEATLGTDGKRGVLFVDGHVERATPERWRKLQAVKPILGTTPNRGRRGNTTIITYSAAP